MESILCQRRVDILKHLFAFSASSAEQIGRDVLENVSPSFVYSEMRRLEEKGFVGRMYFDKKRTGHGGVHPYAQGPRLPRTSVRRKGPGQEVQAPIPRP